MTANHLCESRILLSIQVAYYRQLTGVKRTEYGKLSPSYAELHFLELSNVSVLPRVDGILSSIDSE